VLSNTLMYLSKARLTSFVLWAMEG